MPDDLACGGAHARCVSWISLLSAGVSAVLFRGPDTLLLLFVLLTCRHGPHGLGIRVFVLLTCRHRPHGERVPMRTIDESLSLRRAAKTRKSTRTRTHAHARAHTHIQPHTRTHVHVRTNTSHSKLQSRWHADHQTQTPHSQGCQHQAIGRMRTQICVRGRVRWCVARGAYRRLPLQTVMAPHPASPASVSRVPARPASRNIGLAQQLEAPLVDLRHLGVQEHMRARVCVFVRGCSLLVTSLLWIG